MRKDIRTRKVSYQHFLEAVKAVSHPGDSRYYDNQLSIVGTYYENPLESKILSEPRLEIREVEDEIGVIGITLNADESEREGLDILNLVLSRAEIGVIERESNAYINDYYLALGDVGGELKEYLSKNTILDQVSDYKMNIIITEPQAEQMRFKINGVNYYQYKLTSKGMIEDTEYAHHVHVLFKDKQYDGETFLTQFIGEGITRGEGVKILDTIANENISSMSIGTVRYHTKRDPEFNSFFVAYTSPARLEYVDGTYAVATLESRLVFSEGSIRAVRVDTNEKGTYYSLSIETAENEIVLYLT